MKLIRAALCDGVDHGSGSASIFSRIIAGEYGKSCTPSTPRLRPDAPPGAPFE